MTMISHKLPPIALAASTIAALCALAALFVTEQPAFSLQNSDQHTAVPSDRRTQATAQDQQDPSSEGDSISSSAIPAKIVRYARRVLDRYDTNRDGRLDEAEWQAMKGDPTHCDRDRDGFISLEELTDHTASYGRQREIRLLPPQPGDLLEMPPLLNPEMIEISSERAPGAGESEVPDDDPEAGESLSGPATEPPPSRRRDTKFYVPSSRLPAGLPAAFSNRDRDGDGQLTLAEFAANGSRAELDDFARLDRNGDGVITPSEYLGRAGVPGTKSPAQALSPAKATDEEP